MSLSPFTGCEAKTTDLLCDLKQDLTSLGLIFLTGEEGATQILRALSGSDIILPSDVLWDYVAKCATFSHS